MTSLSRADITIYRSRYFATERSTRFPLTRYKSYANLQIISLGNQSVATKRAVINYITLFGIGTFLHDLLRSSCWIGRVSTTSTWSWKCKTKSISDFENYSQFRKLEFFKLRLSSETLRVIARGRTIHWSRTVLLYSFDKYFLFPTHPPGMKATCIPYGLYILALLFGARYRRSLWRGI